MRRLTSWSGCRRGTRPRLAAIRSSTAVTSSRPGRLFLTASVYTGGEQKFAHEEMTRRIEQHFPDLAFRSTYEETTHGGLLQISMDEGLPFVMGGAR